MAAEGTPLPRRIHPPPLPCVKVACFARPCARERPKPQPPRPRPPHLARLAGPRLLATSPPRQHHQAIPLLAFALSSISSGFSLSHISHSLRNPMPWMVEPRADLLKSCAARQVQSPARSVEPRPSSSFPAPPSTSARFPVPDAFCSRAKLTPLPLLCPSSTSRQVLLDPLARVDRDHALGHFCASRPSRSQPASASLLTILCLWPMRRFRSGVVRIRSTMSICLLHGLVLLPCGISVAGAEDTSAGDATELKWEFDEDLGRYYVSFPDDQ